MKWNSLLLRGILCALAAVLMIVSCSKKDLVPRAEVKVEEFNVLDQTLTIDDYSEANEIIQALIDDAGASGTVSCHIAPKGVKWVRITVYYLGERSIDGNLSSKISAFTPYKQRKGQRIEKGSVLESRCGLAPQA